ncbi:hypothetical protein CH272_16630 [Rhodococcus sp. 05-340-1]|nr:hypothetical protein CH271_01100 [Rhodococcus sp. 05-340-2]OZD75416.1 hypothetical protein CH272_16630 [Rhodococcus sp. 05-340-1]
MIDSSTYTPPPNSQPHPQIICIYRSSTSPTDSTTHTCVLSMSGSPERTPARLSGPSLRIENIELLDRHRS